MRATSPAHYTPTPHHTLTQYGIIMSTHEINLSDNEGIQQQPQQNGNFHLDYDPLESEVSTNNAPPLNVRVSYGCNAILIVSLTILLMDKWWKDRHNLYSNPTCVSLCQPVCTTLTSSCFKNCYNSCDEKSQFVRPSTLGQWILPQAIQHVGLTTANLTRSVEFYTKVMGGVEVVGAGGDGWKGDDVYQLLMQSAIIRGGAALKWCANITSKGPDSMDARYVSFGGMVIELLDYHSDEAVLQRSLFPKFSPSNIPPSVSGNMHISFNIRAEKNLNEFVVALEKESHNAGYENVICNRLVPVKRTSDGKPDVKGVPISDNSFEVTDGTFKGWSLAYCKGPDGEQLEFNQVKEEAKKDFDEALVKYLSGGTNVQ